MPQALWLLLALQLKSWARYLVRNLRTIKGALLALLGVSVLIPWMISLLVMPNNLIAEPHLVLRYGPVFLLAYCLINVSFSLGERAIYFSPAEVNFLFSGPFSRRALLIYKMILTFLVTLPTALVLVLAVRIEGTWFLSSFLGMLFIFSFMQLFNIFLNMLGATLSEKLYGRTKWILLLVVLITLLVALGQALGPTFAFEWDSTLLERFLDTSVWQILSHPFSWFFELILAQNLVELLLAGTKALLTIVGLVVVIFWLDAQYLESAAFTSARIYSQLQRLRGKMTDQGDAASVLTLRWGLPTFPYWGGIGPILWRQHVTAFRSLARVGLIMLLFIILLLLPRLLQNDPDKETGVLVASFSSLGTLSFFLTVLVPFDFRGDLDRLASLKALPIPAWRLTIGQLLTPVFLLTLIHWLLLGILGFIVPHHVHWFLIVGAFMPPFNFLMIALENLLFLLMPVRIMANQPGDFQTMGRQVFSMIAKVFMLSLTVALVGGIGGVVWFFTESITLALVAAWPVLFLLGVALIPFITLAYRTFDVSRDIPA